MVVICGKVDIKGTISNAMLGHVALALKLESKE